MYVLKHIPEDFVVEELVSYRLHDEGRFLLLSVTKRLKNTEDVAVVLAKRFHVPRKAVGYAGSKDRTALTTQHFTIKGKKRKDIPDIEGLALEFLGYLNQPLALGKLIGNKFTITVRNLEGKEVLALPRFVPNYYDEQRFSSNNARIGECLVRKEFKAACALVEEDAQQGRAVAEALERNPNDALGALGKIPLPVLRIYLHAFQSRLWNDILSRYIESAARGVVRVKYSQGSLVFPTRTDKFENKDLPLPGFGFESDDPEIQGYVDAVLKMNSLSPRDFVIRQLPNLSLEGDLRPALMDVKGFEAGAFEDDDLFPGKKKAILSFELGKGSYATMLVKALFFHAA